MRDLPTWFTVAAVGWGTALGGAMAALWFGLFPSHYPNIVAFAATCGAISFVGVADTFRALTKRPMEPSVAIVELILGGALLAFLTQAVLQFFIALVLAFIVRGQAGALTRTIVDLYDSGSAEVARRTRARYTKVLIVTAAIVTIFVLWSRLDKTAGLLHWHSAPIVLLAGISGLVLVSGAEYEVMRTRFRGGQVTADDSFGTGWWGPVAGLITAAVIIAAVVPAPPAVMSVTQVGAVAQKIANSAVPNNTGAQNVKADQSGKGVSISKTGKITITNQSPPYGLYVFFLLLAGLVVVLAVRLVRYSRQLGVEAFDMAMGYVRSFIAVGASMISFFVGFYELLAEGLRGDWSGMRRFLLRWWGWILDVITGRVFRNIWRQLGIRSAAHKEGESFAAEAKARTMAGAAWKLPPGDPRRRVRELYRQFMQEAKNAGVGRKPSQTPRTFREMLESAEPAMAEGLGDLTVAYEWARFSQHPVTPDHLTSASSGWERIAGFLKRLGDRYRSQSSRLATGERRGGIQEEGEGLSVTVRENRPRRV